MVSTLKTRRSDRGWCTCTTKRGAAIPPWRYAVYRDIDPVGGPRTSNTGAVANTTTMGPTYKARAILSWYAALPNCNATPVWGNALDFQIRLDPIR